MEKTIKTKELDKGMLRYSLKDVVIHKINNLYQGFFKIEQYLVSHKLFNGGHSEILSREIFERGDAVVLIPYDPLLDTVILLEQFRPGVIRSGESPWLLEFVAGMFDSNESPEEVAIREAKEEANLNIEASSLVKIMKYFSSPGGLSESIHLYVAKIDSSSFINDQKYNNEQKIFGLPEEGEDILVHCLPREAALSLLAQGKISNAATIIGLQWLAQNYKNLQDIRR